MSTCQRDENQVIVLAGALGNDSGTRAPNPLARGGSGTAGPYLFLTRRATSGRAEGTGALPRVGLYRQ